MSDIYEAKADDEFTIFGTFRPLGTSAPYWHKMLDMPTVYAELPEDQAEGDVNIYDNPKLTGEPIGSISVSRLKEFYGDV